MLLETLKKATRTPCSPGLTVPTLKPLLPNKAPESTGLVPLVALGYHFPDPSIYERLGTRYGY
jgi:hypothetical protein